MQLNESLANTDRRKEPRFRIVLPVMLDKAVGHTEDISVAGIYATFLDLTARLTQGASVRLEMLFYHANPDGPLKVACEEEVARVDQRDDQVGVAAASLPIGRRRGAVGSEPVSTLIARHVLPARRYATSGHLLVKRLLTLSPSERTGR